MGKQLADRERFRKVKDLGRWREILQAYLARISFADDSIGGPTAA